MRAYIVAVFSVVSASGCEFGAEASAPPAVATPPKPLQAAAPAVAVNQGLPPPPLPAHWPGVGVLAKSQDKLPRSAPRWAGVVSEVVEDDSKRFLRATGKAQDIANPALARSTAENRARAELSRWLGADMVAGAKIINVWQHAKQHLTLTQVEVLLPPETLAAAP
jgi:hypothetical protein